MNAIDNKEILAFLVDWLRANNLRRTEQTLLEELELSVKEEVATQLPTRPSDPPYREKSYPFEADCGEVGPVVLETPITEGDSFTDGVDPNLENDEVDVVNFEASLAEQLKQLVNDLSQHGLPPPMPPLETPSPPQSDLPGSPLTPVDEWTDPDDIGFVRIHARPGEELYELCDDAEHRAKAEAYVAMIQAQQSSVVSNISPLPRDSASLLSEPQSPDKLNLEISGDDTSKQSGNLSPTQKENGTTAESETSPLSSVTTSPALGEGSAAWDGVSTPTEVTSESQGNPSKRYPPPTSPTIAPTPSKKYPVYEAFDLKVVYEVNRTGFEEHKDYPIRMHGIIAGRYQILEYLGSAAFSRAVQCVDLKTGQLVCVKIIRNNKDFFDQGLDEIKLLQYINSSGDADESCVLQLYDYFYHKEHLFLVCELLRDNLYEFSKYNRESGDEPYFTIPRLQRIAKQVLTALQYVHSLNLIHCDLKPENILIKSYSRCEIKVIDFGSTCFTTDHLSSYVQSRCYRAPEVILGLPYGPKIDLWSLGAILPELFNGRVLFQNDSVPTMLARIVAIRGPIPDCMLKAGRYTNRFYTRRGTLYERDKDTGAMSYLYPKSTILKARVGTDDELFLDFVSGLLSLNPETRLTASEALRHPWLLHDYGPVR